MATRRRFLAGLLATGALPKPGWAEAGNPSYISAAKMPGGAYRLFGLDSDGRPVFSVPLPGRGHAATAHPHRPETVAFARRPGTFAVILDCSTGGVTASLASPEGRHFMGHGVFSQDGRYLFTPENDYGAGRGVIGVWDAAKDYARAGEFPSAGIGPHDVALMPDGNVLVVANGGIDTHPDSGRAKLNLPTMKPNLAYLDLSGGVLETVELAPELHHNSIRHLSLRADGLVAFAMQWEGDPDVVAPILGLHRRGETPSLLSRETAEQSRMDGYGASVSFSGDGRSVAVSSSHGGLVHVYDAASGAFDWEFAAADVSGLSAQGEGLLATTGTGGIFMLGRNEVLAGNREALAWDNHIVRI
ncbi:DUF1513 domain-containing protein [Sulfitobacter sp. LCG007]